jgi:hypothetical protein
MALTFEDVMTILDKRHQDTLAKIEADKQIHNAEMQKRDAEMQKRDAERSAEMQKRDEEFAAYMKKQDEYQKKQDAK